MQPHLIPLCTHTKVRFPHFFLFVFVAIVAHRIQHISVVLGVPIKTRNSIPSLYQKSTFDDTYKYTMLFHIFAGLWNVQAMIYLCFFVLSGAVADWYFTPRNGTGAAAAKYKLDNNDAWGEDEKLSKETPGEKNISNFPVCRSCLRTFRFHLGTILFGALIIAIVNTIRIVVKYLEENAKVELRYCALVCVCVCARARMCTFACLFVCLCVCVFVFL
jgi:hypothetical protein